MTGAPRTRPAPGARTAPDDAGVTLLELMVAASIMVVVMVMFTSGALLMYRSAQYTEAVTTAQAQLSAAFGRLDRQVRYASQLSEQGALNGNWYVEFLTEPPTGPNRCTQLRLPLPSAGLSALNGRLQIRSWDRGGTPPGFTTLASMVEPTTSSPFSRPTAAQLRVQLAVTVRAASSGPPVRRHSDVLFTLLNYPADTSEVAQCAQQRGS